MVAREGRVRVLGPLLHERRPDRDDQVGPVPAHRPDVDAGRGQDVDPVPAPKVGDVERQLRRGRGVVHQRDRDPGGVRTHREGDVDAGRAGQLGHLGRVAVRRQGLQGRVAVEVVDQRAGGTLVGQLGRQRAPAGVAGGDPVPAPAGRRRHDLARRAHDLDLARAGVGRGRVDDPEMRRLGRRRRRGGQARAWRRSGRGRRPAGGQQDGQQDGRQRHGSGHGRAN